MGGLRTTEAPGVAFWVRTTRAARITRAAAPWRRSLRLGVRELAAISGWPVGVTRELPVARMDSRLVAPSSAIPTRGRVIGEAIYPGKERSLSLSPDDARKHLHLISPSGGGKSTVICHLVGNDVQQGRSVVVFDGKGDLIRDILSTVPADRIGDVVLIDPADSSSSRVVGINPLSPAGRSPGARCGPVSRSVPALLHVRRAADL